jgi:hypothetical protein
MMDKSQRASQAIGESNGMTAENIARQNVVAKSRTVHLPFRAAKTLNH